MVKLPGSVPAPLAGAHSLGPVPDDERFEITVLVRPRNVLPPPAAGATLAGRQYLTREQFEAEHGATQEDMDAVTAYARQYGLVEVARHAARRAVVLSGTAAQVEATFQTALERVEHGAGISRRRAAPVQVPAELERVVEGVFGIEDTPIARPHFQIAGSQGDLDAQATATAFTPVDIARLYDFPADLDGSGQCIAIIELGGGYRSSDLNTYFKSLKLQTPKVSAVLVDGGKNSPSTPWGPTPK